VSVLVRARPTSLDRFSRRHGFKNFGLYGLGIRLSYVGDGFPISALRGYPRSTIAWFPSLPRPAIGDSGGDVVQEYHLLSIAYA